MLQSKVGPGINPKSLLILGTRGVPAAHGGFETFAERLALYLVEKGWSVTVYCQENSANGGLGQPTIEYWKGIRRVRIWTSIKGAAGTIVFDWACVCHALSEPGIPLVLGYNTAMFSALFRLKGRPVLMNMDGIEWKRAKWGLFAKAWFRINEWCGSRIASTLIADHPEIGKYLKEKRSKADVATIAYGADRIMEASTDPVVQMGLSPRAYFVVIGRIEPENSTLEIVGAYSRRKRKYSLVCLGKFDPAGNSYHAQIKAAANGNVVFPGAIYDKTTVRALRFHALAYLHGHTVGGTNPSLVEALGAGNAIIAHDNRFNRWVAGEGQAYFSDVCTCDRIITQFEGEPSRTEELSRKSRRRYDACFTWQAILKQYEILLSRYVPKSGQSVNISNDVQSSLHGTH